MTFVALSARDLAVSGYACPFAWRNLARLTLDNKPCDDYVDKETKPQELGPGFTRSKRFPEATWTAGRLDSISVRKHEKAPRHGA